MTLHSLMMSQANFFLQFKSVVNKSAELKKFQTNLGLQSWPGSPPIGGFGGRLLRLCIVGLHEFKSKSGPYPSSTKAKMKQRATTCSPKNVFVQKLFRKLTIRDAKAVLFLRKWKRENSTSSVFTYVIRLEE